MNAALSRPAPVPQRAPMRMRVKVHTEDGGCSEYEGHFGHSFDACDDALARYGRAAARIFVKVLPPAAPAAINP